MSEALYARVKGSGAPALVLLHGFGGGVDDWYDIQPDLARDGLVLAYDLPPQFQFITLPGAGHMLPVEARKTVISAIRQTMRRAK